MCTSPAPQPRLPASRPSPAPCSAPPNQPKTVYYMVIRPVSDRSPPIPYRIGPRKIATILPREHFPGADMSLTAVIVDDEQLAATN